MVLATVIWSGICVATFLFARASNARDYQTFVRALLGPGWVVFEAAYVLFVVLIPFSTATVASSRSRTPRLCFSLDVR